MAPGRVRRSIIILTGAAKRHRRPMIIIIIMDDVFRSTQNCSINFRSPTSPLGLGLWPVSDYHRAGFITKRYGILFSFPVLLPLSSRRWSPHKRYSNGIQRRWQGRLTGRTKRPLYAYRKGVYCYRRTTSNFALKLARPVL